MSYHFLGHIWSIFGYIDSTNFYKNILSALQILGPEITNGLLTCLRRLVLLEHFILLLNFETLCFFTHKLKLH